MTRKTLILLLALAATPAAAAPATAALVAEVQQALDAGDAAHAGRLAEEGLRDGSASALERGRLHMDHGLASELLGDQAGALLDFTLAINTGALPPADRAQVLLQRGFLLDSMGRLDDAAGDYGAVIRLSPKTAASALNNRANIYRRQNRYADARRDYLASLAAGDTHPEYSYAGLGQVAEAQGDVEGARGYYAKATAANSGYGPAAERLAALGGPLPQAIADAGVQLRPPGAKPLPVDPPVNLKPPSGTPVDDGAIHLRPPQRPTKAFPRPDPPAQPGLPLRPAMDSAGGKGRPTVQLGAWRSQAEAQQGWDRIVKQAGGLLDGGAHKIVMADLPQGRYYRLRLAPGDQDPREICNALKAKGVTCMMVRD